MLLEPDLNGQPVCPVYFILQLGHVNWYTPLLSYLFWGASCFKARHFSIVLSVLNAIFTLVSLHNFVINPVTLPSYVNFAHFFIWLFCFCSFCLLNFLSEKASCLLLSKICHMLSLSFCRPSGVSLYVFILLQ